MFSISGIRGIYGVDLTPKLAYDLARAYVEAFNVKSILIGRDTRPSGFPLEHAIASSLMSCGCNVCLAGVQPTPVVLWACRVMGFDGAIAITASHNPPEWNALKLAVKGLLLDSEGIERLRESLNNLHEGHHTSRGFCWSYDPLGKYIKEALKHLNVDLVRKARLRVVVDVGGGAGYRATPILLRKLGCEVITINSTPSLFNRPIEPTPQALNDLKVAVRSYGADVGFAHDADADRLVCVNEKGEVLVEDYSLAIAALHVLSRRKGPLVVNVASSMIFKWIADNMGVELYWSPVGEVNVVKEVIKHKALIGGEGSSGGIIPAFFNLARDGIFGAALIVEAMAQCKCRISDIVDSMPKYYQAKGHVYCDPAKYHAVIKRLIDELEGLKIDLIDGVKIWLDEGWVLIRPSQTEPKIRILCEADEMSKAQSLVKNYGEIVAEIVKKV